MPRRMGRRLRRLPRILLNAATGVSLLLCAAFVALWLLSERRTDFLTWRSSDRLADGERQWELCNSLGRWGVTFRQQRYGEDANHLVRPAFRHDVQGPPEFVWTESAAWYRASDDRTRVSTRYALGVEFAVASPPPNTKDASEHAVSLSGPWAAVVLFAGLGPGIALGRRVGRRHGTARLGGPCPACGYDLRATPDRCPECGAAPAAPSA
jgi:hypothetical protein